MSEERKPVMCPWCGGNMGISFSEDPFGKIYSRYECEACGTASPFGKPADGEVAAKHNAYLAATATPVVHGEWRVESYMDEYESPPKRVYVGYSCSRCGCSNAIKTRHCARCGARMDGGEHHD